MADSVTTMDRNTDKLAAPQSSGLSQVSFGYIPQTYEQAWDYAKKIANTSIVPKDFRGKSEEVFVAMQLGAEVGLAPLSAIQNVAVINGRPSIWGDSMLALIMNHRAYESHEEYLENEDDPEKMTGVHTIIRKGHKPHTIRFSVADAKTARLWGKEGPWTNYPKRMLRLRARGWALRDKFADALRGMITREEADDYPGVTINAEPSISAADRELYDRCEKLMADAGFNQAQRETKLSKHRAEGTLDVLLSRLETKAAKADGANHGPARTGDSGGADDSVPGVGQQAETGRAEQQGAAEPAQHSASAAGAEPAERNETSAKPVVGKTQKPQGGFEF